MAGRRLEELIDGRLQACNATWPLLMSANTSWSGFPMEREVVYDGNAGSVVFPYTEVVMVTAGSIYVEYRTRGAYEHLHARQGSVTIFPAGYEAKSVSWTPNSMEGLTTALKVQLDTAALERLAPERHPDAGQGVVRQSAIEDPVLASIMRLMEADVAAGCPAGELYGESLSMALAAHVAGRYSSEPIQALPRDRLARPVLNRVLDYIHANLGRDLSITKLAAVANMSPHHFCLRFKASVGVAPHRWVLHTRVRNAERLLRAGSMPIAEISHSLGFANQSHFTHVFRQLTGTTPKYYRRLCGLPATRAMEVPGFGGHPDVRSRDLPRTALDSSGPDADDGEFDCRLGRCSRTRR